MQAQLEILDILDYQGQLESLAELGCKGHQDIQVILDQQDIEGIQAQ